MDKVSAPVQYKAQEKPEESDDVSSEDEEDDKLNNENEDYNSPLEPSVQDRPDVQGSAQDDQFDAGRQ